MAGVFCFVFTGVNKLSTRVGANIFHLVWWRRQYVWARWL
jgi:hypothetical protein